MPESNVSVSTNHSEANNFGVMEFLLACVVFFILVATAGPGLHAETKGLNVERSVGHFVSSIDFAKSEASVKMLPITICPSTADYSGCRKTNNWRGGWIVFVDYDGDGMLEGGEYVLREQSGIDDKDVRMMAEESINEKFTFFPTGLTDLNRTEKLTVCYDQCSEGKVITITRFGRYYVDKYAG